MAAAMNKATCCIVLVAALLFALKGEATISCDDVKSYLNTCFPYLINRSPLVGSCCDGVRELDGAARTTQDRQAVCNCLKSIVSSTIGIDRVKAAELPSQCGVNVPYEISPSTDCSKVV